MKEYGIWNLIPSLLFSRCGILKKIKSLNTGSLSFKDCKMEVILIMGYFDDKEDNLGRVSQCLTEIRKARHGISFPFPGILQLWFFASFPDERLFSGRWRYWEQVVRKGEGALLTFIWVHVSFQDVSI